MSEKEQNNTNQKTMTELATYSASGSTKGNITKEQIVEQIKNSKGGGSK